jgi:energy-coupling factor transporter ATP-binding protein EcfA2
MTDRPLVLVDRDHFVSLEFHRFKAFKLFKLDLRRFNVLVGPNNAGKSTVLAAFRMLAHAMRRAESKKAELLHGPSGMAPGHPIDLTQISVAEENLFYDYDADEPASIRFTLASGNTLTLYFPDHGTCRLFPDAQGSPCASPKTFKAQFRCQIGFVPILGPVEQAEELNERETARRALFNYRAARNFRNTWYHFPDGFDRLRELVKSTWLGMDVTLPEVNNTHDHARLEMWCPESRKPREIAWSGFGFQVWCQMLSHVVRSSEASIFLIDEPDIYLHSDLQRQLVSILRQLGPDVVIATHSTEIISEAETEDIVLVDKKRARSRRLRRPDQLGGVFQSLGSSMNPVMTQIAKTKRVLFVEGDDFRLISRFARKIGFPRVANQSDFAVVRSEGFNPERIRNLIAGMKETLGVDVSAAAIMDSDYRPIGQCEEVEVELRKVCSYVTVLRRKEIENFLLVPSAIDRAIANSLAERRRRSGTSANPIPLAEKALGDFAGLQKGYVLAQRLDFAKRWDRENGRGTHEATINEKAIAELESLWSDPTARLKIVGGKAALTYVAAAAKETLEASVTPSSIIEAMQVREIPSEMNKIVSELDTFSRGGAAPTNAAKGA